MTVIAGCVVNCHRLPAPLATVVPFSVPAIFFCISVPLPSNTFILLISNNKHGFHFQHTAHSLAQFNTDRLLQTSVYVERYVGVHTYIDTSTFKDQTATDSLLYL